MNKILIILFIKTIGNTFITFNCNFLRYYIDRVILGIKRDQYLYRFIYICER